jgi:hypothetical protein
MRGSEYCNIELLLDGEDITIVLFKETKLVIVIIMLMPLFPLTDLQYIYIRPPKVAVGLQNLGLY